MSLWSCTHLQLVNHGIDPTFLDKTKLETHDLFSLPMEEKKKFWQKPDEMEGFGQAFVLSEDQKLDWADIFFFTMQPAQLRKPHLFPQLPLPFRFCMHTNVLTFSTNSTQLLSNYNFLYVFQRHIRDVFR